MLTFVLKRLLSGLVVLFVVACITFVLLFIGSGSVARNILGDQATEEQVAAKAAELGLDQPLFSQLLNWWSGALQGDFGTSWFTNQPVLGALTDRLPVTLVMVIVSIILIAILATVLGVTAAVKRGWVDRLVQILAVIGNAVPGFIIGVFLVYFLALQMGWFPAISKIAPGKGPEIWAASLALPIIALVINGVASAAQQIRSAFIKQLELDYVRTLRSRGIPEREILFKHVLRASAPAGLTVLSLQFISLLGGVVVIETIFAINGMGRLAVDATTRSDAPVVMAVVVYTVVIVVIVNTLVDIANGWLNPKVRVS